jgi:hypothetical protein
MRGNFVSAEFDRDTRVAKPSTQAVAAHLFGGREEPRRVRDLGHS